MASNKFIVYKQLVVAGLGVVLHARATHRHVVVELVLETPMMK